MMRAPVGLDQSLQARKAVAQSSASKDMTAIVMPVRSALGHETLCRLSMFERRPVFAGRDPEVLLEEVAEMRSALESK